MKREIRRGKDTYRRKLEERLQQNNVRDAWRGLEKISGHNKSSGRGPESGDLEWANELNLFFNRFDSVPTPSPTHQNTDLLPSHSLWHTSPSFPGTSATPPSHPLTPLHSSAPYPHLPQLESPSPILSITADQVRRELRRNKARKATGPDGISSRLLKDCADQLCEVVLHIFNSASVWRESRSCGRLPVWLQFQRLHTPGSPTTSDL